MEPQSYPCVERAGDSAVLVLFGDSLDPDVNRAVHAFDALLDRERIDGIEERIPAIRSLLVRYDPARIRGDDLIDGIRGLLDNPDPQAVAAGDHARWRLPVHYGDELGPDLGEVARCLGLTENETIDVHSSTTMRVLMLGFAPGLAYIGTLPEQWDLPRLDHIKPRVAAGSLSVAVRQTVMPATPIPTGWRTIGQTPFTSFDPHRPPHFLLGPGDEISFEPVSLADYRALDDDRQAGRRSLDDFRIS